MKKGDTTKWINRTVNAGLFWTFCLLISSGVILEYRLGTEFLDPTGATIWGMDWQKWSILHQTLGFIICSLILIHLWMNRLWIWAIATAKRSWAVLIGIAIGLALLLTPLLIGIQSNSP